MKHHHAGIPPVNQVLLSLRRSSDGSPILEPDELSADLKRQGYDVSPRELEALWKEYPTDLRQFLDNLFTLLCVKRLETEGKVISFERAGRTVYAPTAAGCVAAGEPSPTTH